MTLQVLFDCVMTELGKYRHYLPMPHVRRLMCPTEYKFIPEHAICFVFKQENSA